jgi:hypothetical protein
VRVRVFNETQRPHFQGQDPDETRSPFRVLPKKTSWEEALARFDQSSPLAPADRSVTEGSTLRDLRSK